MLSENLTHKIATLPTSPGCYLMKSQGKIIYVGKAVNLRNRVRSYFRGEHTPKVAAMVERVDDFDIVLCQSNFEALTLECNLIKKHRPFYNILLKDDKHYPYLRLDPSEHFPRLTLARRMSLTDGARYFGPYMGATAIKEVMQEVGKLFPLRTCSMALPVEKPRRPCVLAEIGRCCAPCAHRVTEEEYALVLSGATSFLSGDNKAVIDSLKTQMQEAALHLRYEEAALYRDKIKDVEHFTLRQHAIQLRGVDQDILAASVSGEDALVYLGHVREGRMEEGESFLLEGSGGESVESLLSGFLPQYYEEAPLIPPQILCQALPPEEIGELTELLKLRRGAALTLTQPQRGEKHQLILIAEKNAQDALLKYRLRRDVKEERTKKALLGLQELLSLPQVPKRIEGYDISNLSGELSVGALVVFENAAPCKNDYRIFRIRTVEGPNDFASLQEVLIRRFTGSTTLPPPDVLLIDGGPEQLSACVDALNRVDVHLPMLGLTDGNGDLYLPSSPEPLSVDKHSGVQLLLQAVRDEAHRFGITHHRNLRSKQMAHSVLDDIPGIGPQRKKALLKRFGSVKGVLAASQGDLEEVVPSSVAKEIVDRQKS